MSRSGFLRFGVLYFSTSLTLSMSIVTSGPRSTVHPAAFLVYARDLSGKLDLLPLLHLGMIDDRMRKAIARNRDVYAVLNDPFAKAAGIATSSRMEIPRAVP
ncbi:hypothetical protein [Mesorhizobium sp. M0312]|uniref:hypothetical protein n=1 Tax=Mesorhizobium sp. M0312 TaxID=2956934 RepID=UPI00333B7D8B